jgi:hypothetical protein
MSEPQKDWTDEQEARYQAVKEKIVLTPPNPGPKAMTLVDVLDALTRLPLEMTVCGASTPVYLWARDNDAPVTRIYYDDSAKRVVIS